MLHTGIENAATTTTLTRQLADDTLIARCDTEQAGALPWLLDMLTTRHYERPLAAGSTVRVGWTVLALQRRDSGAVLLCEPNFAADPWNSLLPDVTRSLAVLRAHAAMLNRLPPGVEGREIAFYDRLVVARGALDQPALVAQRDAAAFAGHGGWYIGTTEGLDTALPPQQRYETPFVYELLTRRPSVLPALVLPLGTQIQLDGDGVTSMRLADGTLL